MDAYRPASEEDVVFVIRMALSLDERGKPKRLKAALSPCEKVSLAQKIARHLRRSHLWPHQGQSDEAHSAPLAERGE